jgi:hypothetical protein
MDAGRSQYARKRKWGGILVALGVVFCVGTYLWFFWFQTLMVIQTRYSYRHIPIASMTPVELGDHTVASGTGTKLSCFGYEFEVPWQDVDTDNIQRKAMVLVPFRSGLEILVGHGSTHDLVDTVIESTKITPQHFRAAYGDGAARSDYGFLSLALNATPAKVRLFASKEDVVRQSTLVLVKAIIVPGDSGIFEVQANEFRGFQYGDPIKHPKKITVTLYSADGGIELTFAQRGGKPLTAVSQADINRIIQTMHYTSPTATALK